MSSLWFEMFREAPQTAVADLFSGRAGTGSSLRLDVPELLRLWFPQNMTEERSQLDSALLAWLQEMRDQYPSEVERLGFNVYGKRVGDALIALQLLDLPKARKAIREDMDTWLCWLSPLRLAPERDPALECLRLLTHDQTDIQHMAMWFRLAVDGRAEYLTVALAGLRLLPNNGDAWINQVLMLQALLRNAAISFPDVGGAQRHFKRQFAALRGLFPRGPEHWHTALEQALSAFSAGQQSQVAKDLASDLREQQTLERSLRRHQPRQAPAPEREWQMLLRHIRAPRGDASELAQRLFKVAQQNHEYALATGNSYFFVHGLSHLGNELLKNHTLAPADLTQFGIMIERALVWEPANPYCWTLWAQWFKAQGQRDAQEAVLREMLRMFPRNIAGQVELSRVLIDRGDADWHEAEHYLNLAIHQDPNNGRAHVVMARLRTLRGQSDEAEAGLVGFLKRNPDSKEARYALDRIRSKSFAYTPPAEPPPSTHQADNASGGTTTASSGILNEVRRRGRLTEEFNRARIADHPLAAGTELISQQSLAGDVLAGFYSQWLYPQDVSVPPPHAWAWNACRQWQQPFALDAWEELAERFPEAAAETNFLCALAQPDSANARWQGRYRAGNDIEVRAVDQLMRELGNTWEKLAIEKASQRDRDDMACAVMACAAIDVPQFTASLG